MLRPFLYAIILTLAGNAAFAQEIYRPKLAAADIDASLRTDWFGLYLQGKKIGYFHSSRARQGETIRESFGMHMKLVSFGQKAEMNIHQELTFENKEPYRLLEGSMEQKDNQNHLKIRAKRAGDEFDLTQEVAGQTRMRKVKDHQYQLSDAMASEVWLKSGPKEADAIGYYEFDLQEWKMDKSKSKVLAIKTALVAGVDVKYYELETESRAEMIRLLSRHDSKGNMLSGQFAIFEIRAEPEAQAKNTEYSQDLFVLGMVKIDKKIGSTVKLEELVLEVTGKEAEVFEAGPRQVIERPEAGKAVLKLGKTFGKKVEATKAEIEEALNETNHHAIHHPKVKELAQKAVGDAKTPEEKVRNITKFVQSYVLPSLSANLPNIHDLMERRRGDCKSYALLFTNLARASGIPAREVSGLLYMGDDQKAFGGHAWNEVVLDGAWVPIDASLGQTDLDAGHISFGPEQKAIRNMVETLGKLQFKVLSSKGG